MKRSEVDKTDAGTFTYQQVAHLFPMHHCKPSDWLSGELQCYSITGKLQQTTTVTQQVNHYSPHRLHRHGLENMSPTCCVHSEAPEEQTKQMGD